MKTSLIFSSFCLICFGSMHSQTYNYEPEIIDSLFMGTPVRGVVGDSMDTLWFVNKSNNLYKSFGDSLWIYNSSNSNLTAKEINEIAIDSKDTIWLLTEKGLVKYDHNNFTTYDTTNTNIPPYWYHELVIDKDDNIWFSSSMFQDGGIIKYDKNDFYVFTPDNSLLPTSLINSIVVDQENNVWIATSEITYEASIVKIAGKEWTIYNENSIGIPLYYFMYKSLIVDSNNNLLIKISYSLSSSSNIGMPAIIKYDGTSWGVIDTVNYHGDWHKIFGLDINNNVWAIGWGSNAVLSYYDGHEWNIWGKPIYSIYDIKIGIDGYTWLLTSNGVYILKTDTPDKTKSIYNNEKINIFPNPTQGIINIDFDEYAYCEVYNMMGVRILTTKDKTIDLKNFESGIYFVNVKDKRGKKEIRKVILKKEY